MVSGCLEGLNKFQEFTLAIQNDQPLSSWITNLRSLANHSDENFSAAVLQQENNCSFATLHETGPVTPPPEGTDAHPNTYEAHENDLLIPYQTTCGSESDLKTAEQNHLSKEDQDIDFLIEEDVFGDDSDVISLSDSNSDRANGGTPVSAPVRAISAEATETPGGAGTEVRESSVKSLVRSIATIPEMVSPTKSMSTRSSKAIETGDLVYVEALLFNESEVLKPLHTGTLTVSQELVGPYKVLEKLASGHFLLDIPMEMKGPDTYDVHDLKKALSVAPHAPIPGLSPTTEPQVDTHDSPAITSPATDVLRSFAGVSDSLDTEFQTARTRAAEPRRLLITLTLPKSPASGDKGTIGSDDKITNVRKLGRGYRIYMQTPSGGDYTTTLGELRTGARMIWESYLETHPVVAQRVAQKKRIVSDDDDVEE